MPDLHKHCKQAHLPRRGGKLRLGTLSSYRKEENAAIRDDLEGMYQIRFQFDPDRPISRQYLRDLTLDTYPFFGGKPGISATHNAIVRPVFGARSDGVLSATDNALEILAVDGDQLRLSGEVILHYEQRDAFVFCMSHGKEVRSVIHDEEYDAVWSIAESEIGVFAELLNKAVGAQIGEPTTFSKETVGPFAHPTLAPPRSFLERNPTFGVRCRWGDVHYENKILHVTEEHETIEEVHRLLDAADFIKPPRYSPEREFRFCVVPFLEADRQRRPVPVYCNPLLIDVDPFLDLIRVS